jgi:hypothetical protein
VKRASVLLAAFALVMTPAVVRAQDGVEDILWAICPELVGTAAEIALRRFHLPSEDVAVVAEIACWVADEYRQAAARPRTEPDTRTAEEIFCEGSFLEACAGVPGSATMSPGLRCVTKGMSFEKCMVWVVESEAGRR